MIIEKTIIDYLLSKELTDINTNVYAEVPVERPLEYLLVEKTGGGIDNHIRSATVTVESVTKTSLYKAMTINENVIKAMLQMPNEENIYSCYLNSTYTFTDTRNKEYCSHAVFSITYDE